MDRLPAIVNSVSVLAKESGALGGRNGRSLGSKMLPDRRPATRSVHNGSEDLDPLNLSCAWR